MPSDFIRNRSVWPILLLLNVFTALKGTHLYIFICYELYNDIYEKVLDMDYYENIVHAIDMMLTDGLS